MIICIHEQNGLTASEKNQYNVAVNNAVQRIFGKVYDSYVNSMVTSQ